MQIPADGIHQPSLSLLHFIQLLTPWPGVPCKDGLQQNNLLFPLDPQFYTLVGKTTMQLVTLSPKLKVRIAKFMFK